MRENRTSGSEGGEPGNRHSPTPIAKSASARTRTPMLQVQILYVAGANWLTSRIWRVRSVPSLEGI